MGGGELGNIDITVSGRNQDFANGQSLPDLLGRDQ